MLLKHPSAYKHQIAFTFPGTKRKFYEHLRQMLEENEGIRSLAAEFNIKSGNDTVFAEQIWGTVPAQEFYDSYRDAVLIVVLFDETYQKSEGAYPEWSIIRDMRAHLHGRVIPMKFDKCSDFWIRDAHFNGPVDLIGKDETDQLKELLAKIAFVWEQCLSPWRSNPENIIIHFEKCRPKRIPPNVSLFELPNLCVANESIIFNTISNGAFLEMHPLRTVSVYCPKIRANEWFLLGKIVARISQNYQTRRRSSVRIPVFIPDDAQIQENERGEKFQLEDLIWICGNGAANPRSACERKFRLWSELSDWLKKVSTLPIVNLLTASDVSCEMGVDLVQQYEAGPNEDVIVNFWRWCPDSLYRKGSPYAFNIHDLHNAATYGRSNLIHLSEQFASDILEWKASLNIDPQFAEALQNEIIEVLCDPPHPHRPFQWQPFLPTNRKITRRADRIVLSRFNSELPNGNDTENPDSFQKTTPQ